MIVLPGRAVFGTQCRIGSSMLAISKPDIPIVDSARHSSFIIGAFHGTALIEGFKVPTLGLVSDLTSHHLSAQDFMLPQFIKTCERHGWNLVHSTSRGIVSDAAHP